MREFEDWPASDLEAVRCCPVCGSAGRTELYRGLRDRVYYAAPGSWTFYRCVSCGAAYLDPRPTPASIGRAYARYATHEPPPIDGQAPGFRGWLRRSLRNGYINRRYGSSLSPRLSVGALVVPALPGKRSQIDLSVRYLPRRMASGARVLDIGCGNGSFLRIARQIGWQPYGVDTDAEAVAHGAGLGAKLGGFPSIDFPGDHFDAITLSHVIEHVHDPVRALREVLRLLRPGGQLTLITPNLEGWCHRKFGADWIGLHPPAHVVLFTLKSVARALQASGFLRLRFRHVYGQVQENSGFSTRIGSGVRPFSGVPARTALFATAHARIGELAAGLTRRLGENIVVTAIKPR